MPRADLVMSDGTKVTIQGTADEVASMVGRLTGASAEPTDHKPKSGTRKSAPSRSPAQRKATSRTNAGPRELIRELKESDFFKAKRGLGDVQKALEEAAHIYPITTLSPVLFRMVRSKELRRLKEDGTWKYVNP